MNVSQDPATALLEVSVVPAIDIDIDALRANDVTKLP